MNKKCEKCGNEVQLKGSFQSSKADFRGYYIEISIYQCPVCKEIIIEQ